ncbi:MAG: SH3 domain-containing protein [Spirulinaceae cyanobacterium RM2_2_10]|nr:SH3 domain-containing protein [Spirulinaceae cyanobacterium SM2_1_0]NJO19111.1 SH3 domain-containing protein [Spirulinaceae cyanobacterium RM2_2_10]
MQPATALWINHQRQRRLWLAVGLTVTLSSCSATGASRVPTADEVNSLALELSRSECEVMAYARDPQPTSLELRTEPNEEAPVIVALPDEAVIELTVTIVIAQDEWLRVDRAVSEADRLEFAGQGWTPAEQLSLRTKGYDTDGVPLYASANEESQVLAQLPADYPVTLVSCDRDWVKVETETTQGWLAPQDQCANPYTSCS